MTYIDHFPQILTYDVIMCKFQLFKIRISTQLRFKLPNWNYICYGQMIPVSIVEFDFWSLDEVVGDLRIHVRPYVCAYVRPSRCCLKTVHYFFLKFAVS